MKIVSGGQTGVDRAALDAALAQGVAAGGWCPEGREAEDGVIPDKYPLDVLPGAGYRERTRRNVLDSGGTLIVYFGHPSGGTEQTMVFCVEAGKPYLLIDAEKLSVKRALAKARAFVDRFSIGVLNVAGPRSSSEPRGYEYTRHLIERLLQDAA